MTKLNPVTELIAVCLFLVTAFVVPILGPVRSSGAHLLVAGLVALCGVILVVALLRPRAPDKPDTQV
jgi:hypothetical protein